MRLSDHARNNHKKGTSKLDLLLKQIKNMAADDFVLPARISSRKEVAVFQSSEVDILSQETKAWLKRNDLGVYIHPNGPVLYDKRIEGEFERVRLRVKSEVYGFKVMGVGLVGLALSLFMILVGQTIPELIMCSLLMALVGLASYIFGSDLESIFAPETFLNSVRALPDDQHLGDLARINANKTPLNTATDQLNRLKKIKPEVIQLPIELDAWSKDCLTSDDAEWLAQEGLTIVRGDMSNKIYLYSDDRERRLEEMKSVPLTLDQLEEVRHELVKKPA